MALNATIKAARAVEAGCGFAVVATEVKASVAASIAAAVEQQGAATQEIVRNVAQASPAPTR